MSDGGADELMEICACSREVARAALEAAGPGGLELAVSLVLEGGGQPPPRPARTGVKLVCLVRQDLRMTAGKVAAQVAHGVLGAYRAIEQEPKHAHALRAWLDGGEPTIILGVADEAQLLEMLAAARESGLLTHCVQDAGRTQVEPGSRTVGCVGPGVVDAIDAITGNLALLP